MLIEVHNERTELNLTLASTTETQPECRRALIDDDAPRRRNCAWHLAELGDPDPPSDE